MSKQEKNKQKKMDQFFDSVSDTYDETRNNADAFEFYAVLSTTIAATQDEIPILDLGCGTGLELASIFKQAPHAQITGIDVSEKMLAILKQKYSDYLNQMTLIKDSYITYPFSKGAYDYAISVSTMHHFLPDRKQNIYEKIKAALRPHGVYIEGDWAVTPEDEQKYLSGYKEATQSLSGSESGDYHIDIPFTISTQQKILKKAGFKEIEIVWETPKQYILVAK